MSDGERFFKEESEVQVDKMRFKAVSCRPVNTGDTVQKTKEDIRGLLWVIFKKYTG